VADLTSESTASSPQVKRPELSSEGLGASIEVTAYDEFGEAREGHIAAERALTIYLDKREVLTLMTLGSQPELLVKLEHKTVTTGCGQGTMFGSLMDRLSQINLAAPKIKQSQIYELLKSLNAHNDVYRKAGAVHGCALCEGNEILSFVEDVGRHNAVDTIAGYMWLEGITGDNKWFYTTGRLTSEMIIKVAQMGIPVLLSRSGVTQMGLELAQQLGVVLIARAKGRHFMIYNGVEQIEFDR